MDYLVNHERLIVFLEVLYDKLERLKWGAELGRSQADILSDTTLAYVEDSVVLPLSRRLMDLASAIELLEDEFEEGIVDEYLLTETLVLIEEIIKEEGRVGVKK